MPKKNSKSKPGPAALGAMGAAPLGLALVLGAVIPSGGLKPVTNDPNAAVQCESSIEGYTQCHASYPTGCSPTGNYDAYLNTLKNQHPARNSTAVKFFTSMADYHDLESRTPGTLAKSNHFSLKDDLAKMGEGQEYGVIGYLYYAKQENAESSNCELTAPEDTDYHIGIGFDAKVAAAAGSKSAPSASDKLAMKEDAVVVEMTPQYRADLAPEWTLDALKKVLGKQVRVVGQLMADNEHNVPKDNCGLAGHGPTCWRASIWELHPVTSFQWCNAADCSKDPSAWVDLGQEPKAAASAPAK
ncbi:MAG TPA: hypothetical protein VEU96_23255 [Bryobacteraceae bacterium]|nr:hypothetical protein [Bryobacteraceae bacterium]